MRSMIRLFPPVALVTGFALWLAACESVRYAHVPQEQLMGAFERGEAVLDCRSCFYYEHQALELIEEQDYARLAMEISKRGSDSGNAWYYLGRSAEALGHSEAAIIYYRKAMKTSSRPVNLGDPKAVDIVARTVRLRSRGETHTCPFDVVYARADTELRGGPDRSHSVVRRVAAGEPLSCAQRTGLWYRLEALDPGTEEWVYMGSVSPEHP